MFLVVGGIPAMVALCSLEVADSKNAPWSRIPPLSQNKIHGIWASPSVDDVMMIGRHCDPAEFAAVEPMDPACFTGIQHYIARTGIKMGVHGGLAQWAARDTLQVLGIRRMPRVGWCASAGAQIVGETHEVLHGDQHSLALFAIEQGVVEQSGLLKTVAAGGAICVGGA